LSSCGTGTPYSPARSYAQHEEVVGDLERNIRRILDFCGLEFESSCIEFYRTERAVRTASSEQVRLPIFSAGLDQWRHFKSHLGSLEAALRQEGFNAD
jgi:hypothetical protein